MSVRQLIFSAFGVRANKMFLPQGLCTLLMAHFPFRSFLSHSLFDLCSIVFRTFPIATHLLSHSSTWFDHNFSTFFIFTLTSFQLTTTFSERFIEPLMLRFTVFFYFHFSLCFFYSLQKHVGHRTFVGQDKEKKVRTRMCHHCRFIDILDFSLCN